MSNEVKNSCLCAFGRFCPVHAVQVWPNVPTPPASPTVTLDRETYKKACELAQEVRDHSTTFDVDEFPSLGRELLALLRAAERQK